MNVGLGVIFEVELIKRCVQALTVYGDCLCASIWCHCDAGNGTAFRVGCDFLNLEFFLAHFPNRSQAEAATTSANADFCLTYMP